MNNPTQLSNGISFYPTSLDQNHKIAHHQLKPTTKDLLNVLGDPKQIKSKGNKIYLGQSATNPSKNDRIPIYLPSELLSSHILIAGAIGSGKTSLLLRLIAGVLKTHSIVISEAKGGIKGSAKGAAFTNIAKYLQQKYSHLQTFRWPRGNCTFNPLLHLKTHQDRRTFFDAACQQLQINSGITGEMVAFIYNATHIAELIINYLQSFYRPEDVPQACTLRNMVYYLRQPMLLRQEIESLEQKLQQKLDNQQNVQLQRSLNYLTSIKHQLEMLNFFYLHKPEFIMTRHGVNCLVNLFDHQDLLYYSEPQENLVELNIEDLLYQKSLVVISQPLNDPASKVVGPLFWDSLLTKIIELGPNPESKNGQPRQKIIAVLDETHRLPIGRLGDSGDFLREYNLGLIEITPTIVDEERWQQNKHVYQTIISLSPGVPAVVELIRSRLPNTFLKPTYVNPNLDAKGNSKIELKFNPNFKYSLSEDNPGVSARSLSMTGKYTGLIQSIELDNKGQVFWIDFEDELFKHIKQLLSEAVEPHCPTDVKKAVDYVLGLSDFT